MSIHPCIILDFRRHSFGTRPPTQVGTRSRHSNSSWLFSFCVRTWIEVEFRQPRCHLGSGVAFSLFFISLLACKFSGIKITTNWHLMSIRCTEIATLCSDAYSSGSQWQNFRVVAFVRKTPWPRLFCASPNEFLKFSYTNSAISSDVVLSRSRVRFFLRSEGPH